MDVFGFPEKIICEEITDHQYKSSQPAAFYVTFVTNNSIVPVYLCVEVTIKD